MNNICIMGRITNDLETKMTPNGISVCAFTVAVKRPHVKDVTDFIPCVAWRNNAEFVTKYFGKGNMIAVVGMLTTRKYDDKNGNKRTAFEVVVDSLDFCGDKHAEKAAEDPAQDVPQKEHNKEPYCNCGARMDGDT